MRAYKVHFSLIIYQVSCLNVWLANLKIVCTTMYVYSNGRQTTFDVMLCPVRTAQLQSTQLSKSNKGQMCSGVELIELWKTSIFYFCTNLKREAFCAVWVCWTLFLQVTLFNRGEAVTPDRLTDGRLLSDVFAQMFVLVSCSARARFCDEWSLCFLCCMCSAAVASTIVRVWKALRVRPSTTPRNSTTGPVCWRTSKSFITYVLKPVQQKQNKSR